jgi:hypothetical protein
MIVMKSLIAMAVGVFLVGLASHSDANNLVWNGGFEISSNPGMPDAWGNGQFGIKYADEIHTADQVRERFQLDSSEKFQGNTSFRLSNPATGRQQALHSSWIKLPVFLVSPDGWCLSAYIKSDPPSKVKLEILDSGNVLIAGSEFDAAGEFQRFFTTFNTKKSPVIVRISGSPGTSCWIDNVQMERGSVPSEWAAAADDNKLDVATVTSRNLISTVDGAAEFQKSGFDAVEKVELRNKFLYVNGKPFYPYACNLAWVGGDVESFRMLKTEGFNSIVFYALDLESTKSALDAAFCVGLRAIPWLECSNEQAVEIVDSLKTHPALLFWQATDEPPEPFARNVVDRVKVLKELDLNHPVMVNFFSHSIQQYLEKLHELPGDIISSDLYPISNLDWPGTAIDPADLIFKMDRALASSGKVPMFYLLLTGQAFGWTREPTSEELEGMVYSSCIAGARGLYFFQNVPWNSLMLKNAGQIGLELDSLAPVLASQAMAPKIQCSSDAIRLTCRVYGGNLYLICVNTSKEPVKAEFSTEAGLKGLVNVIFEGRTIDPIAKNAFSDEFAGYQRRVYQAAFFPK